MTPLHTLLALVPFWTQGIMPQEPLLFIVEETTKPACVTPLYQPSKIMKLESTSGQVTFEAERDFVWEKSTGRICRTANSRIPFLLSSDLHPPAKAANSLPHYRYDKRKNILFSERELFAARQVQLTYEHAIPQALGEKSPPLPRTSALRGHLEAGRPVTIAVLGDSISVGMGATGFIGMPPRQPGYVGLVKEALESAYASKINLRNYAVSGTQCDVASSNLARAIADAPQLVIIAFGMNDSSGRVPPANFSHCISRVIKKIKDPLPKVELVLVTSMTANPDWSESSPGIVYRYRDELLKMASPSTAVADVTAVWLEMLKRKHYLELTANGVNHPGDFGHRVYAQVVLQSLGLGARVFRPLPLQPVRPERAEAPAPLKTAIQ